MAMEKLGVSKEQLLEELRTEYNEIKARKVSLTKEASGKSTEDVDKQLERISARIDEVEKSDS